MSNVKNQIEADYNGRFESEDDRPEIAMYMQAFGVEFDLLDDDQYWLTNDSKEKSK